MSNFISSVSIPDVDITPTPRILRTLGDIPFDIWQCFAELADNSIDAFKQAEENGTTLVSPRIDIYWSSEAVSQKDREIVVEDNAGGMDLDTLQSAARAGYSSNDPIHHLGLFGMGFNISTARLGDETLFVSTRSGDLNWVGIRIDFDRLIKDGGFAAEVIEQPKPDPGISGTKIIIRKIKDGIFADLKTKQTQIRRRLESVYTPILQTFSVGFYLNARKLDPAPHCVWGKDRFVIRRGERISAIQEIDRDLGNTFFDVSKNRYCNEDETATFELMIPSDIPPHITVRPRRLRGWVGIQRYSDTSDFGIDFIRNGRKILISDKAVFSTENPDTGGTFQEYPVELGSTVGGRIVGEVNVDYLIPTYQKNAFDTSDRAWRLTIEAIRGAGPLLPGKRTALGYSDENKSPLGQLVNAYRRTDPGTKNLALQKGVAADFLKKFKAQDPTYVDDSLWFKAAQEADRDRSDGVSLKTPVNQGDDPSDDIDQYYPSSVPPQAAALVTPDSTKSSPSVFNTTSDLDELLKNSTIQASLSGKYAYGNTPGLDVTVRRMNDHRIFENGEQVPVKLSVVGIECDFFFDSHHTILNQYPISPKQLLLLSLAERFAVRDNNVTVKQAYFRLITRHLEDERINSAALIERANTIFGVLRERLPIVLEKQVDAALAIVGRIPSDEEELVRNLLVQAPHLVAAYNNRTSDAVLTLAFISNDALIRVVEGLPEIFLDGKVFSMPYLEIKMNADDATKRLRQASLKAIINYLLDVSSFIGSSRSLSKFELLRNSNTLAILEDRIVQ
ncbi:ATP-binding protein [Agrobacterium vitis]